jgi:predicted RNA-binding protein with TRAM domain
MGMAEVGVTVEVEIEVSTEVLLLQNQLRVGKEYEVDITEISRQGNGIARVQGFVIFVKNGKVKQNVKVKVE